MGIKEAQIFHLSQLELRDDFSEKLLADASINPKDAQLYYLFEKWRKANQGGRNQESMMAVLAEKIRLYKEKGHIIECISEPFAIAVVTPLMQRVHEIRSSSEICFMDSSSSCDDEGHVLTFILTATTIGALPLGFLITRGQSTACYAAGLSLLKRLLGEKAFNGQLQPAIVMTDDSAAEKAAISEVWPQSRQLLCQFHIAQAMWRWLWNADHGVANHDRKPLMDLFRQVTYATTLVDLENGYEALTESPISMRYPNFIRHIELLWERRDQWTKFDRMENFALRGHNTNNFSESAVRVYKDVVLSRCKAYNAVSLVEFTCNALESHYADRLRNFAYCRVQKQHHILRRLLTKAEYIKSADEILRMEDGTFAVPSALGDDGYYNVDVTVGLCVCVEGATGKFCKHQAAVMKFFDIEFPNAPAVTSSDRHMAAVLALGKKAPNRGFFVGLHEPIAGTSNSQVFASSAEGILEPMETDMTVECSSGDTESPHSSNDARTTKKEKMGALLQEFVQVWDQHASRNGDDDNLLATMEMFVKRAKRAPTVSAFSNLLASCNAQIKIRSKGNIGVQPTTKSRRPVDVTNGSKRLPAGRPSASLKRSAKSKRKHSLAKNVELGQPNAKF